MPADWNEIRRLAASPERMQRKEALSQARVRLIEFLTDRGFAVQSGQVQDSLKRFFREKDRVRLQPANPNYPAQFYPDVRIQGKLIGVIRRLD